MIKLWRRNAMKQAQGIGRTLCPFVGDHFQKKRKTPIVARSEYHHDGYLVFHVETGM
jgi:hypothetical protein